MNCVHCEYTLHLYVYAAEIALMSSVNYMISRVVFFFAHALVNNCNSLSDFC